MCWIQILKSGNLPPLPSPDKNHFLRIHRPFRKTCSYGCRDRSSRMEKAEKIGWKMKRRIKPSAQLAPLPPSYSSPDPITAHCPPTLKRTFDQRGLEGSSWQWDRNAMNLQMFESNLLILIHRKRVGSWRSAFLAVPNPEPPKMNLPLLEPCESELKPGKLWAAHHLSWNRSSPRKKWMRVHLDQEPLYPKVKHNKLFKRIKTKTGVYRRSQCLNAECVAHLDNKRKKPLKRRLQLSGLFPMHNWLSQAPFLSSIQND